VPAILSLVLQSDVAGASTSELLWYNAMQSLPLLLGITAANGDFGRISQHVKTGSAAHGVMYFYFMVVAASTMGCLLNYRCGDYGDEHMIDKQLDVI
jgi:solute carrier family 35 protein